MSTFRSAAGAIAVIVAVVAVVITQRGEPEAAGQAQTAIVERVIDGDTFTATTAGGEDLGRIRVLGIDTPEMARDGNPAECYAQVATDAAKQLLEGRTVQISSDPAEGERDQYDRVLAFVDVEGTDFAETMLSNGHARSYKGSPLQRQSVYDDAARDAQDSNVGLWVKC